jgi:transcriptional regulator with XRE-family HTH domain|tara:strand:+ start:410 stop:613 length:204 start_codon:yes stop_codon:yes gene_type:complete
MKSNNLAEKIKFAIDSKGIKSKHLAGKLGVSEAMFSYLINGQRRWQPHQVDKICLELNIERKDLECS